MRILLAIKRVLKHPIVSTLGVFASANMIATAMVGIAGVIQARWVSPEVLGEFHKYGILTGYLAIGLVVVQDGLARQFPYLIGKGLKDEAIKVASVAKCWYVFVAGVSVLLFLVLTILSALKGDMMAVAGWGTQSVVVVAGTYGVYLQTIYRRSMEFKRLSYNGLIASSLSFVLLVVVKFWGYFGLVIKTVVFNIVRVLLDARYLPVKIRMTWDRACFVELAKMSIPLSLEGYIRTSFMTATFGFFVVKYCSPEDLGVYGIAAAFEGFAMIFVNSLVQIFDVKMANKFGEAESMKNGFYALVKPTVFGVCLSVVFAVILCLVIGPFISICVPHYVASIPVVYILSLALPISASIMPTRLLRVALMYKSIYAIAIMRVLVMVLCVHLVPRTVCWFAFCRVMSEAASVALGYVLLMVAIRREGANYGSE